MQAGQNGKLILVLILMMGFPGGTSGKESTCNAGDVNDAMFDPWVGKIPWKRAWQPTSVFLSGESHGQRSLADYCPYSRKGSDTTEATQQAQY